MNRPKCILTLVSAAAFGACLYAVTKKKQKRACETGSHVPYGPYEAVVKRCLDVMLSGTALLVLSPVLGITALLVRIKLGAPVLFIQERPGLDEQIFRICKFRTMTDVRGDDGGLLPDEERLTDFGKKLRSTSLDELPELFNILKGDMAVVGPRPLLAEYLPLYDSKQKHRHDVRPGLTGYAQVCGRNAVTWDERFKYDMEYVSHITFFGDLKILLQTVMLVLQRKGISSETSVTMEKFMGNG